MSYSLTQGLKIKKIPPFFNFSFLFSSFSVASLVYRLGSISKTRFDTKSLIDQLDSELKFQHKEKKRKQYGPRSYKRGLMAEKSKLRY